MGLCESTNKNTVSSEPIRKDTLILNNDVLVSNVDGNIDQVYKKIKLLGEGSYGKVWLVRNEILKKEFALKIIKIRKNDDNKILNEIKILKRLDHPLILKIIEFHSTGTEYRIITDYCQNGDLYTEINNRRKFSEREASFIIYQVLLAINYCHKMGIIHRDIKPENIMIDRKEVSGLIHIKLIDFGVAKIFRKNMINRTFAGSTTYMAPEVMTADYNEKSDLWSIGVILYVLLVRILPFNNSKEKTQYNTLNSDYLSLSENAKDLISKLLKYDATERITAEDALKHHFFNTDDINNIYYLDYNIVIKLLMNLEKYKSDNIIKSTVLAYLIHLNSNIQEYIDASKLFHSLDSDHDGKLNKNDLIIAFVKYFNLSNEQAINKADQIFKNIDTNKNELIENEEFIVGCINPEIFYSYDYLKFAFYFFDKNHNGSISISEIIDKFSETSKLSTKSKEQLVNMFNQIDSNKDGCISFDEFSFFIKATI